MYNQISLIRIKKSPFSQLRKGKARLTVQPAIENSKEGKTKQRTKDQEIKTTWKQYEQQCQSHTCPGTINSSIYHTEFSITTFPLALSATYSGLRPVKTLTCVLSFCSNSGSKGRTQPCYWLATNKNTRRQPKKKKHNTINKTHKNKDQVGLKEAPHLQDFTQNHSEYSKCWNSKKRIFPYWATL